MHKIVDVEEGMAALKARFCNAARYAMREGKSPDLHGITSAMSLLLFGHDGIIEGMMHDAANNMLRHILTNADSTDEQLLKVFADDLPEMVYGATLVRRAVTTTTYIANPAKSLTA